jgi:hypothetical protein
MCRPGPLALRSCRETGTLLCRKNDWIKRNLCQGNPLDVTGHATKVGTVRLIGEEMMHCNYLCLANDEVSSREMSRGWQQSLWLNPFEND